jgi:hypothetical protein
MLERIEKLILMAEDAVAFREVQEIEAFVASTENYLNELEMWQAEVKALSSAQEDGTRESDPRIREALNRLGEIHQKLMQKADVAKDNVGSQMGDMHKKAQGLKKYIDILPSRITIAGKRKG